MNFNAQDERLVSQPDSDGVSPSSLSAFAHEVLQPVTAICQFSDLAKRRFDLKTQPELLEYVNGIRQAALHAAHLLAEIRDHGCESRFDLQVECLEDIVGRAVDIVRMQSSCKARTIEISCSFESSGMHVDVDRTAITQVLINLLRNAVEATYENPRQRIVQLHARQFQQVAEVVVRDNGGGLRGIAPEQLFHHVQSSKQHGAGLGLAISQRIVSGHGGKIWYTPGDPSGACFHFTLPLPTISTTKNSCYSVA